MKRPESIILDEIEAAIFEVHSCEKQMAALRQNLLGKTRAIRSITDLQTRINVAVYAYWHLLDAPAEAISWAVTDQEQPNRFLKLAGPVAVGLLCTECDSPLPIRSRFQMKEIQDQLRTSEQSSYRYRPVCPHCAEKIGEQRRKESAQQRQHEDARKEWLSSLGYSEYLDTPDWITALQSFVDFRRWEIKSHELPCELCSQEKAIGAYH